MCYRKQEGYTGKQLNYWMDYDSFARYIRKLAPYTELHDLRIGSRDDNYGQIFEYTHKEYVTAWCLQKREEGDKLQG